MSARRGRIARSVTTSASGRNGRIRKNHWTRRTGCTWFATERAMS